MADAAPPADGDDTATASEANQSETKEVATDLPATSAAPKRLRDLWRAPALVLGLTLLIMGLLAVRKSAPGPDFDAALRDVQSLLKAQRADEALDQLNNVIRPRLGDPAATADIVGRFHALRGDVLYFAQLAKGVDNPQNFEAIVNEYRLAEERLGKLALDSEGRMVDGLIALGQIDDAADRTLALPVEQRDLRTELLRKIISANLAAPRLRYDLTLNLLTTLAAQSGLTPRDRLWVSTRMATLMLDAGFPGQALERLLQEAQRFQSLDGEPGARLLLLLGRAYFDLGRFEDASDQFDRVISMLTGNEQLSATATTYLGRSIQALGKTQEARDHFSHVVSTAPHSAAAPMALLGLAETESLLGGFEASLAAYRDLTERARKGDVSERRLPIATVVRSLNNRMIEREEREDLPNALAFAQLAEGLFVDKDPPPETLLAIARIRRQLADKLLRDQNADPADPVSLAKLDPVTRAEVRAHYADAANHYLRHARAVILSDNDAFADSLWSAAETFDLAGDPNKAIDIFGEYLRAKPDDPREPQALFRLGQLHEANGDYKIAEDLYAELIAKHPNSPEGTRALVALGRVRLRDGDSENDAVAEQLLRRAISGELLSPDSRDYRSALFEIAALLLRTDRYEEAIERFAEAIERYPDDADINTTRYRFAEALRRSAEDLGATLREAMPDSQRRELSTLRNERLTKAMALYEQVRGALERTPTDSLTEVQRMRLRNTYFYRADSAFDLEDYDTAIRLYDAAAQRYASDPSSLVAMAQIVASYLALGDLKAAQTAQERARNRFLELPEDAFDDASLPAGRSFWEQWLKSRLTLADAQSQENDGG